MPINAESPTQQAKTLTDLLLLVKEEVSVAMREGVNWKLVLNGCGAVEIAYVMEKHGRVRPVKTPQT